MMIKECTLGLTLALTCGSVAFGAEGPEVNVRSSSVGAEQVGQEGQEDSHVVRAVATRPGSGDVVLDASWDEIASSIEGKSVTELVPGDPVTDRTYVPAPTVFRLPLGPDLKEVEYHSESAELSVLPSFDHLGRLLEHYEVLAWSGEAEGGAFGTLTFIREEGADWRLGAGHVETSSGIWGVSVEDDGTVVAQPFSVDTADEDDFYTEKEIQEAEEVLQVRRERVASGFASTGTVLIDVLAVAMNGGGGTVSASTALSNTVTGATLFDEANDVSSSSSWNIEGVRAIVRGVALIETTSSSQDKQTQIDVLKNSSAVGDTAASLGVDVIAGYRGLITGCGKVDTSLLYMVWKATCPGGPSGQTFAHEVGHFLVGFTHSNSGYNGVTGERTLMYGTNSSLRRTRFSNPEVQWPGTSGQNTGTTSKNNAKRVYENAAGLAATHSYIAPSGGTYYPLSVPIRLVDTRDGTGGLNSVGTSATPIAVATSGVPVGARVAVVNVVVISGSGDNGSLRFGTTASSATSAQPVMEYIANDYRASTQSLSLGSYRQTYIRAEQTVEVVIDVVGYYGENQTGGSGRFHERSTATRIQNGTINSTKTIDVSGDCPGSGTIVAAMVNIAVVNPASAGFVKVNQSSADAGDHSTVNFLPGDVISNLTIAPTTSTSFKIKTTTPVYVIVDLFGCFRAGTSGRLYVPYSTPVHRYTGTLGNNVYKDVGTSGAVPLVVLRATANTNPTFFQVYRYGGSVPPTSSMNLVAGERVSNLAVSGSVSNKIRVKRGDHAGTTSIVVAQVGYFS